MAPCPHVSEAVEPVVISQRPTPLYNAWAAEPYLPVAFAFLAPPAGMELGRRAALLILVSWYAVLTLCGLHIFTSGFLLRRAALTNASDCKVLPDAGLTVDGAGGEGSCWVRRRYKKAVILVVDALRYDFAAFSEELAELEANGASIPPFRNRLPEVHR